jgi:hypothetical protein
MSKLISKSYYNERMLVLERRLKAAEAALKYKPDDDKRAKRFEAAFLAVENWRTYGEWRGGIRRWAAEPANAAPKSPYNYHGLPTKPGEIYCYHKYNRWKYE